VDGTGDDEDEDEDEYDDVGDLGESNGDTNRLEVTGAGVGRDTDIGARVETLPVILL
jgi:hypothetical protein